MPVPRLTTPNLVLPTVGGGTFDLSKDAGPEGTLLVFYRGLHCPLCIMQLTELTAELGEFTKRGVNVVAVTTDAIERASEMHTRIESDALTIAYDLPLVEASKDWGLYLSTSRGKTSIGIEETPIFPEPGLFYIKPDQTLYFSSVQTMPFARPAICDLIGALDFIKEKNYPARGEYKLVS
jgi:peroxiredoxin